MALNPETNNKATILRTDPTQEPDGVTASWESGACWDPDVRETRTSMGRKEAVELE